MFLCSKSHFAFHGVGRSLEVPRVNFSLGWFCIWCGGWRHSMQIIAGVFTGTNLQKVREHERERQIFVVENLVMKHESKAWCCGHLRQRIKVLHPVILYYGVTAFFDHLLGDSGGQRPCYAQLQRGCHMKSVIVDTGHVKTSSNQQCCSHRGE